MARKKKFVFGQAYDPRVRGRMDSWEISWTSMPTMEYTKRCFLIKIFTGDGYLIRNIMQEGVPDDDQIIYALLRTMSLANGVKPRTMNLAYRMRNEFAAVSQKMRRFGIADTLQTFENNLWTC